MVATLADGRSRSRDTRESQSTSSQSMHGWLRTIQRTGLPLQVAVVATLADGKSRSRDTRENQNTSSQAVHGWLRTIQRTALPLQEAVAATAATALSTGLEGKSVLEKQIRLEETKRAMKGAVKGAMRVAMKAAVKVAMKAVMKGATTEVWRLSPHTQQALQWKGTTLHGAAR